MLWHDNKPRPSEHSQVPLTAECSSRGRTRLLSKQSADRLINRRVCKGVCCSLFLHPVNTHSFYLHGFYVAVPSLCGFVTTAHGSTNLDSEL